MNENLPLTNPSPLVNMSDEQIKLLKQALSAIGSVGGRSTSDAKRRASKENGKKGGRPKGKRETKRKEDGSL